MENKRLRKPRPAYAGLMHACRHEPAHIARVSKTYERQVFCINVEIWNESHIDWELFQTLIFSPYKAINGTFSKHTENPKGKPKFY